MFKIHANMDPKHRDRLAFVKIVSGIFKAVRRQFGCYRAHHNIVFIYNHRVILEKPKDPIQFLLETIQDDPFVFEEEPDA